VIGNTHFLSNRALMNTVSKSEKLHLLSELSEDQARGDILQIYQEIRQLSAVPMVALIWRHLATLPGTLEWAWGFLGPAMRGGELQRIAWEIAEKTRIPRQPEIHVAALRAAGISEKDQRGITQTLDGYNRANPVNFVMVRCLSLHLAVTTVANHSQAWPHWQPPPPPSALLPMIKPEAMSPTVHALAMLLTNRGADAAPSALLPSLYRHLANWPAFLGYASVLVPPEFEAIDAAAAQMRQQVDLACASLTSRLVPAADRLAPSGQQSAQLKGALEQFSIRIPEMVVIGNLLRAALPAPLGTHKPNPSSS
jgi:hypothetical protein